MLIAVDVINAWVARLLSGREEGIEERIVTLRRGQHLRSRISVVGVATSQTIFKPTEIGQTMREVPIFEPWLTSPSRVIEWITADPDHAIDAA